MFNYSSMGLNYPNFYPNKRYSYYHIPRPYFPYSRSFSRNNTFNNKDNINKWSNSDLSLSTPTDLSTPCTLNCATNISSQESIKESDKKNSTNENTSRSTICYESNPKEQASFSILGLNLYFDDILILCLLFFLYTEEVKDEMLFICLIMLLLS